MSAAHSVAPSGPGAPGPEPAALRRALAELAAQGARLRGALDRLMPQLDADTQRRLAAQARYHDGRTRAALAEVGLSLVSHEGEPFDPGFCATALNLEDFPDHEPSSLRVDMMLEPVVLGPDGPIRPGLLTVAPADPAAAWVRP